MMNQPPPLKNLIRTVQDGYISQGTVSNSFGAWWNALDKVVESSNEKTTECLFKSMNQISCTKIYGPAFNEQWKVLTHCTNQVPRNTLGQFNRIVSDFHHKKIAPGFSIQQHWLKQVR